MGRSAHKCYLDTLVKGIGLKNLHMNWPRKMHALLISIRPAKRQRVAESESTDDMQLSPPFMQGEGDISMCP